MIPFAFCCIPWERVGTNLLNRFFGQKPVDEHKSEDVAAPESRKGEDAMSEERANPFKNSLSRTRQLFSRMGNAFRQNEITDELWDDLEETLLSSDIGPGTSMWLLDRLKQRVVDEHFKTGGQVQKALREELVKLLGKTAPLTFARDSLTVILVIGVNGSGKTTSIAKMAYRLKREGHNVMLAAADTFRAAAIDQLKVWAERIDVPVISQNPGSDPGAVVYDAIQAATSRGCDVLIVDTAGRMQNKYNLMEELKKINKVIQKFLPGGPQELLIVMDATNGQNALLQARQFAADIGLTGVIITKLDGTAKGGFAFAVADDLGVPIKFIGTGEKIENLAPFDPQSFVAALFAQD